MERKKIILIALSSFALLALLTIFFFVSKNRQSTTTETSKTTSVPASSSSLSSSFPVSDNQNAKPEIISSSNQDKSILITPQGEKIEINNPEKIATEKLDPKDMVLKTSSNYQIVYFNYSEGPSFLISITSKNLDAARKDGETDFLSTLGITKEQACKLKVSLTVPQDVSAKAAGDNYHLSFCSNGKAFPK